MTTLKLACIAVALLLGLWLLNQPSDAGLALGSGMIAVAAVLFVWLAVKTWRE